MIEGLAAMAGTVGRALLDETWLGPVGGLIGIGTATFTVLRDLWVGRLAAFWKSGSNSQRGANTPTTCFWRQ